MLSQDKLKEILDYDPSTGIFIWKISASPRSAIGSAAGFVHHTGYHLIKINKKQYPAHRLAWVYMYGSFPVDYIDHINGNKTDNRIVNLRNATNRENQQNQKRHRDGKKAGVYFDTRRKKWIAIIQINRKRIYIGSFPTESDAHPAYLEAALNLKTEETSK
jgi:HNH endonuclease/AP2 domain